MRIAWLLALCGCDGILHLEKVSAPNPQADAALDTSVAPFCDDKKSALLCADFEGTFPPPFFASSVSYNLPQVPSGVMTAPTTSPDGVGLSIDATGTAYSFGAKTGSSITATKIDIELLMRFDRVTTFTGTTALVSIGVDQNNAGFGSCRVELQLNDAPRRLTMQDYCGTNRYPDVFLTFPTDWNKLGLVLDLANNTATTYVNGTMTAQLDLGTGLTAGSAPFAYVGFDGPCDAGVSFDDVVAVVAP